MKINFIKEKFKHLTELQKFMAYCLAYIFELTNFMLRKDYLNEGTLILGKRIYLCREQSCNKIFMKKIVYNVTNLHLLRKDCLTI